MTGEDDARSWGIDPDTTRELVWRDPAGGLSYEIRVRHRVNATPTGLDHLEIETIKPARAALPITETGYLSHFTPPNAVIQGGGADPFVRALLNRASGTKAWRQRERNARQGDLFAWSDANAPRPALPTAKSRRSSHREPS